MPEEILIITRGWSTPLAVQAMGQALAKGSGLPITHIWHNDISGFDHEELLARAHEATFSILYDPPLEPAFDTLSNLPGSRRIYSGEYVLAYAKSLAMWHQRHCLPGWYETWSPLFEGLSHMEPILLPPVGIPDSDPANPLRQPGARPEIAIISPPVTHDQARALQREYLFHTKGHISIVMLKTASNMQEMAERLAHYENFYIPGYQDKLQWSFELSCLLYSGATITGSIPDLLQEFCPETHSIEQAAALNYEHCKSPIFNYRKKVLKKITSSFLDTLVG